MSTETTSVQSTAARARRGFETSPGESGGLSVALWGDLSLGWFSKLARALARRGISIQSAAATRDGDDTWAGRIELDVSQASVDPLELNYLSLTEEDTGPLLGLSAPIERFRIERTETNAICLRVFAHDKLGLLSGLLDRVQFLGLFPVRLRVSTDGPLVDDTIWLRGVASHPPSTEAERALTALLNELSTLSAAGHA
jgi:hypothetical protein